MGSTLPRSVISPVIATVRRTGRLVKTEMTAAAMVIPADGPSAGITIATAMISVFLNRPVRRAVAMTGEITLRGNVLPIGGLKEKMLAARRAGITVVLVPKLNKKDVEEIAPHLKRGLEIHLVDEVDEVLRLALIPPLEPRTVSGAGPKSTPRTFPGKPRSKPVTV